MLIHKSAYPGIRRFAILFGFCNFSVKGITHLMRALFNGTRSPQDGSHDLFRGILIFLWRVGKIEGVSDTRFFVNERFSVNNLEFVRGKYAYQTKRIVFRICYKRFVKHPSPFQSACFPAYCCFPKYCPRSLDLEKYFPSLKKSRRLPSPKYPGDFQDRPRCSRQDCKERARQCYRLCRCV